MKSIEELNNLELKIMKTQLRNANQALLAILCNDDLSHLRYRTKQLLNQIELQLSHVNNAYYKLPQDERIKVILQELELEND